LLKSGTPEKVRKYIGKKLIFLLFVVLKIKNLPRD